MHRRVAVSAANPTIGRHKRADLQRMTATAAAMRPFAFGCAATDACVVGFAALTATLRGRLREDDVGWCTVLWSRTHEAGQDRIARPSVVTCRFRTNPYARLAQTNVLVPLRDGGLRRYARVRSLAVPAENGAADHRALSRLPGQARLPGRMVGVGQMRGAGLRRHRSMGRCGRIFQRFVRGIPARVVGDRVALSGRRVDCLCHLLRLGDAHGSGKGPQGVGWAPARRVDSCDAS